ncbi:hypothetical protein Tco_1080748 [Tanacetum coccineum]|uniref:Uncharacterized protein n=1 Tax=Tanacetum coccineum TaxID=301880 RepID=A0ABQ5HVK4_9ASTR
MIKKLNTAEVLDLQLVLLLESKNEVCLLCEERLKQIPAFDFFCASLETISAIENALGKVRDCQHGIYTTGGGVSRVDEMILAKERSGFCREEVWGDIPVVTGFLGRERRL